MAFLENCIGYGLLSERPAPGAPGALWFTSDTGMGYRDNGTSWDVIVTPGTPALSVVAMTDDLTITQADVLVICTDAAQAAGKALTMPPAADWAGHFVYVITPLGNVPTITVQSPDLLLASSPSIMVSDGTNWYGVDR